jgi:hypothetical protein
VLARELREKPGNTLARGANHFRAFLMGKPPRAEQEDVKKPSLLMTRQEGCEPPKKLEYKAGQPIEELCSISPQPAGKKPLRPRIHDVIEGTDICVEDHRKLILHGITL